MTHNKVTKSDIDIISISPAVNSFVSGNGIQGYLLVIDYEVSVCNLSLIITMKVTDKIPSLDEVRQEVIEQLGKV